MPDGRIKNELAVGNYDIEVSSGPSFAVQKELAIEFLINLCQISPQVFPLVADYIAKNLDVQFMPQIAERFKNLVPPAILAKEEGRDPPPPPPPSPEEQLAQAEIMEKKQALQERAEELEIRKQKHKLEEAELMLKARELNQKAGSHRMEMALDNKKLDNDFTAKMADLLSNFHQSKHAATTRGTTIKENK